MEKAPDNCILCEEARREVLIRKGGWTVLKCAGCGLGFLDPRPGADELQGLYAAEYFQEQYDRGLLPDSPEMKRRLSQETHRVRFFRHLKKTGRVLDIGCGMGYFLQACRLQGYEVEGMDISADSAAYMQTVLQIRVRTGTAASIDYAGDSFDVITMWHFLEHTPDPRVYLEKARKWLKPSGLLVLDVPNYDGTDARKTWSAWKGWQLPYHLFHFTPATIGGLLERSGFRVIRKKDYLSEYMKERIERIPLMKPLARPIARLYSGHSYAVVAEKSIPSNPPDASREPFMKSSSPSLDRMIASREFRFDRLILRDIDNTPVIRINASDIVEQETCLFHRDVSNGDEYLERLHGFIRSGVDERRPSPVVRFADGEYAFYRGSLHCNGLYQQAESAQAIRKAMPLHAEAIRTVAERGMIAPLIFPRNTRKQERGVFSFSRRSGEEDWASGFLEFLADHGITLTGTNYLPFYVVYAYLTSKAFAVFMDGRKLCIVNSEFNDESCNRWFAAFSSRPIITFAEIPASYVATRWMSMKEEVLGRIPPDTDLCLVGAGAGALLACVDAALQFRIPTIDAGHVLNMLNDHEAKSNGPRMYTLRKSDASGRSPS